MAVAATSARYLVYVLNCTLLYTGDETPFADKDSELKWIEHCAQSFVNSGGRASPRGLTLLYAGKKGPLTEAFMKMKYV